jgi:hypothetical protein
MSRVHTDRPRWNGRANRRIPSINRRRSGWWQEFFFIRVTLSDGTDRRAVAAVCTIDEDRYPLSPQLAPLKAVPAKLDPP